MSETVLRWLHITDLHVGGRDESQVTALRSLLTSAAKFAQGRPFDAILISGDLAYSGEESQYSLFKDLIIAPLRESSLWQNAQVISTPGNHDLNCDVEIPPSWTNIGRPRQEKFFHSGEEGIRTRGSRAKAFDQYSKFITSAGVKSVDPLAAPAATFRIEHGTAPVTFISVVTAFFSDKDVTDRRRAPAPVHAVRTALQQVPDGDVVVVLGHHPVDWFTPESEAQFHSLLVESNAIYLHGHEHKTRTRFGQRGLISLGFGAAYQAPQEDATGSPYRNSFAICELSDVLDIAVVSWDAEHGLWRPDKNLPGDFVDRSDRLEDGYRLNLPTTRVVGHPRPYASLASAIKAQLSVDECLWLSGGQAQRWTSLLTEIGTLRGSTETYSLPTQTLPAGHSQFRVRDAVGRYLVRAVSGHGDILNLEQLQAVNTELDRQDYDGAIVVTLGELATDARILATQLSSRKQLKVLERSELLREVVRCLPASLESALLRMAEPNDLSACLVFTPTGTALLLRERRTSSWFAVLTESGVLLPESSDLVSQLRNELPPLQHTQYGLPSAGGKFRNAPERNSVEFDRTLYLQKSYEHFDNVKYAPLAALGFRFRSTSLSEIYVEPSAQVGGASKSSMALTQAVNEFIDSLNLPTAQREQIELQLRSRHGLSISSEVGVARKLYQRYNSVLVLGDPGSGKTCFVKHEILAYCAPVTTEPGWYSRHLPVYVSLAEAARLVDENTGLLDACVTVAARRGLELPRPVLDSSLADGTAAFFFDGLDEVGYLDKRIALLSDIDKLAKAYAPRGCRFVLTSRPAAIQPVDIPDALTYLQLSGLTEGEIRVLAARVLTNRFGIPDASDLDPDETSLIDRLLEDTKLKPGIARIARNPLLLTLLVLIYANSGALSARRHVIYTQAIKTLVSVRGRQTRQQQISEADLRTRLGAVALAILRREIAEIPRRQEVVGVLSRQMAARSPTGIRTADITADANNYLQEVAEATGLLSIHSGENKGDDEYVTFMHYSFLEYYAAAGLLAGSYMDDVPQLAANPRWKDVTTLLFGMLSEQADVTPLLSRLMEPESEAERISQYKLLLGLDCASECDVPPEAAQDLLAEALYSCLASGAGRFSADLRAEIAERMEPLIGSRSSRFEMAIVRGLSHENPLSSAAFADVIARLAEDIELTQPILVAFREFMRIDDPLARTSAMFAIERRPELRDDSALSVVRATLKGSVIEKLAALRVVSSVPRFSHELHDALSELLESSNVVVATEAARCLLLELLRSGRPPEAAPLLERALRTLDRGMTDDRAGAPGPLTIDRSQLESLLQSTDARERELAYRYVPWTQDDHPYVYRVLMHGLRNEEAVALQAACLDSLRASGGARALITIADTDLICTKLTHVSTNVRLAAVKLLGDMPDDEQVVSNLQRHLESDVDRTDSAEALEAARALAKHVQRNPRLRDDTLRTVLDKLPRNAADGFGSPPNQRYLEALLLVCESIGGVADNAAAWRLYDLATDYRTPLPIRTRALRVFGRIVEPSSRSVAAISRLLGNADPRLTEASYGAVLSFALHCKRKVEFVRRVFPSLPSILQVLCECWRREETQRQQSINPPSLSNLRDSVVEVTNLMLAYDEFSGLAKLENQTQFTL